MAPDNQPLETATRSCEAKVGVERTPHALLGVPIGARVGHPVRKVERGVQGKMCAVS